MVNNRGRVTSSVRSDDDFQKISRTRSKSRSRPFARTRSKSRSRFETRDAPEHADVEEVNKFVQYKKFGLYATEISRVIAIDEIPEVEHGYQVVVKIKVSMASGLARVNLCFPYRNKI
jgi:hypothetical protein